MLAPCKHSITWMIGPFGCLIPCYHPNLNFVYLLHFSEKYPNGKKPQHYLGSTCDLDHRLAMHKSGTGARLTAVIKDVGIDFEVCRLWQCESYEEAKNLERALKRRHGPGRLCPYCQGKRVDPLTQLRQGHWCFDLFERPGRRLPMSQEPLPRFVRRVD